MYAILSSVPMEQPTYSLPKRSRRRYGKGTGCCYAASFRRHISHYRQRRILASRCRCGRRHGRQSPRIFGCTVETRHRAFLETLDFAEKIKDADLIITGEGKSDRQTLMGKVPSGILQEARRQHIPVILLAGAIEDAGILNAAGFRGVFSITPSPVSLEQAMQPKFAQENIRRTVEQICRIFF